MIEVPPLGGTTYKLIGEFLYSFFNFDRPFFKLFACLLIIDRQDSFILIFRKNYDARLLLCALLPMAYITVDTTLIVRNKLYSSLRVNTGFTSFFTLSY